MRYVVAVAEHTHLRIECRLLQPLNLLHLTLRHLCCGSTLQRVALCCRVLQCAAESCRVLQSVAVCCRMLHVLTKQSARALLEKQKSPVETYIGGWCGAVRT